MMRSRLSQSLGLLSFLLANGPSAAQPNGPNADCHLQPKGLGFDDTEQIQAAIAACGNGGNIVFDSGEYNITRKMEWNLQNASVDLHGVLSFQPNITYWLEPESTYRAIIIQDQASWFVVTGHDFKIDAHNIGGIKGNGQPWWSYFATRTREDGDGRPVSLSLVNVTRGIVTNFHVEAPPFWCNAVSQSQDVLYDGMTCNATNEDPLFAGQNIVPNTDGINTYRSDNVTLLHWDVTCGDDCLAIKGNSSNIHANIIKCRGGNGIAFGSLGQYGPLQPDFVTNVVLENIEMIRINSTIQPNMKNGVYLKTWTGSVNGSPPTGGGGGGGRVSNITTRNIKLDSVDIPLHIYQTNGGHSADLPSKLVFEGLQFINWTGQSTGKKLVDIECSTSCTDLSFNSFDVAPPADQTPQYVCVNTTDVTGLPVACPA